jgi:acyl-coenzyme A synthetase/AMP-(fatty) acid ligase/3-hydroxymyristoyl/3-hydroxydecanoyl-(acyl carrier protein) dehydratase
VSEPAAAVGFIPLAELLRTGRNPRARVAFARDVERDWADFAARVGSLSAEIAARRSARLLLFSEDSYAFAVGLFAIAHAGARALVAPNQQPQTLSELAAQADGALVDPGIGEDELAGLPRLDPLGAPGTRATRFEALDPDRPLVELSTSGTTGPGKAVPKSLRHLDLELAVQEALFGTRLGGARVFATVSHQHLYGLLFRVLWPLASGRPFSAETFLHTEELFPRMREAGEFALATTPVHLRRMRADAELAGLRAGCRAIFSSGGPLDDDVARDVAALVGQAPLEIFGSSETGGVAWRAQSLVGPSARWQPFPSVELSADPDESRLVVTSPFVSVGSSPHAGGPQTLVMGDRVELHADGAFALLGRADRIVKVGEKRLALPEMESHLRAHAFVADAALVAFDAGGDARVGAVVALSDAGQAALAENGRRALGATLGDHLAGYWDRVLLPRAWRYLAELPRDPQGKLAQAKLLELLDEGAKPVERALVREPILISEQRAENKLVRELRVPADLAFLEGHFPGRPLVAGVVQLHWAMQAARELVGPALRVGALSGVRLRDVLEPEQSFALEVELAPDRASLRFRLFAGERTFASGRAALVPVGSP